MRARRSYCQEQALAALALAASATFALFGLVKLPGHVAVHWDASRQADTTWPVLLAFLPSLSGTAAIFFTVSRSAQFLRRLPKLTRALVDLPVNFVIGLLVGLQAALIVANLGAPGPGPRLSPAVAALPRGTGLLFMAVGAVMLTGVDREVGPAGRSSSPAALDVDAEWLVVRFSPLFRWLALRRQLRIPLYHCAGSSVVRREQLHPARPRVAGTSIPRVAVAGLFGRGRSREFWAVSGAASAVLLIEGSESAHYRRLVLEVAAPQQESDAINGAAPESATRTVGL